MPSTATLSMEQAPPITVPLRFFLTAPFYGVLAGFLMLWAGPDPWSNRWSPPMLALTHLLVLGLFTQIMFGALLQMLPVVAGSPVRHPLRVSRGVHGLLNTGAPILVFGLLTSHPWMLVLASVLLSGAFLWLIGAVGASLWRVPFAQPTPRAMTLALTALAVTAAMGVLLAALHGWRLTPAWRGVLGTLHPAWGLMGWISLLILGVAYQVVPMFQITPVYPKTITRWLAPFMFVCLTGWSLGRWLNLDVITALGAAGLALGLTLFAGTTLWLQTQRRRRLADVTVNFWRTSLAALLAAVLLGVATGLWLSPQPGVLPDQLLGVLFLYGFTLSVINGMLYKIVPFLVWLHLEMHPTGRGRLPPNMREIIPTRQSRHQFRAHLGALALLLATAWQPSLFLYPAALAAMVSNAWLARNLWGAWGVYSGLTGRISNKLQDTSNK